MEIIKKETDDRIFSFGPYDKYFKGLNVGVLDIETTGLSPRYASCILIGLLIPENDCGTLYQYFSDKGGLEDEKEIMICAAEAMQELDAVVTYNGRSFDIPFLNSRSAFHGIYIPPLYDLDLLPVIRKHSPLRSFLPNLKQKTVEDLMGLRQLRDDLITGRDSIGMYCDFLRSGDEKLRHYILLHNSDDVLQLNKLTAVLKKCDVHAAMSDLGFPVKQSGKLLIADRIAVKKDLINVFGRQLTSDIGAVEFGDETGVSYDFSRARNDFEVQIDLLHAEGVKFADIDRMGLDSREFECYPNAAEGFLAIEDRGEIFYGQLNMMIKRILERIISKWTT